MKFSAQINGADTLSAKLSKLGQANGLHEALKASVSVARDAAVANLVNDQPSDGRVTALIQSLKISPSGSTSFTLSTPLNYGWYLENGTLSRPATPWLAPALNVARPLIEYRLGQWLARGARGLRKDL